MSKFIECAGCKVTSAVKRIYEDAANAGPHSGRPWCAACGGRPTAKGVVHEPVLAKGVRVVYSFAGVEIETVVKAIRRDGSVHIAQGYGGANAYVNAKSLRLA